MKFPVGLQDFEKLRRGGYAYVDKTALIYKLVYEGSYYFLSRPRRFGKSLLLTTLKAYFEGKKELFGGLSIANLEETWDVYPVLHLDLNSREYSTLDALDAELNRHLEVWERLYGSSSYANRASEERLLHVIEHAYSVTGKPVVLLVDEYDKPLLQTLDNAPLQTAYRNKLKAFYSVVKTLDAKLRFAFFTGVTKFGQVSVFSDLNNLIDLSTMPAYAGLCGVTEEELHRDFDEEVAALSRSVGTDKASCYELLRKRYDGYRFSTSDVGVYNPYSLLSTFLQKRFGDYWFETGTPSFLVGLLKRTHYDLRYLNEERVAADTLFDVENTQSSPVPLLYQSGYLTIKAYDERFRKYLLGFPNEEVEHGFVTYLAPYYSRLGTSHTEFSIEKFVEDVENGRAQSLMKRLDAMFADGDYRLVGDTELYFHNALYIVFKLLGFFVQVERATSDGRMDMVVKAKGYIYIFEFKIDSTAEKALAQIRDKAYVKPFAESGNTIFLLGVNFSTKTRRLDGWKVASPNQ